MFTKLTEPPTPSLTLTPAPAPAPDRHEHKSLICNHPHRDAIEFLIDTVAIRNDPNSFNNNLICLSNRHKPGLCNVPQDGATRQSARRPSTSLSSVEPPAPSFQNSTRNKLGSRNRLNIPAINDINFSTRNKTGGVANRDSAQFHESRITSHESRVTNDSPLTTARVNHPSKSKRSAVRAKPGSVWRMISLLADLKGSSEGMRASQR